MNNEQNLITAETHQINIVDVMPSSCIFNGERRAIVDQSKHFYYFACGTYFKWNYSEKHLCTDLRF